ncbi:Tfp pilus assembly protein FimT/FimU [Glaesserella sp.]|uniref:pilus assembly FimT family protein n=1 Tax=Glaesserella sp. TaxID=2094731 RepID=UPI0035A0CB7B
MFRAFTLIELLTAFTVVVISLYFISPTIFRIQENILLHQEIDQIKTFLYQVQSHSRYAKKHYSLTVSQREEEKKWCMIAIEKSYSKQRVCDCFNLPSCNISSHYYVYHNIHPQIQLKSNSLYPRAFIDIDGRSARLSPKCLDMRTNHAREIIQFDQNGVVNVVQEQKRSTCR